MRERAIIYMPLSSPLSNTLFFILVCLAEDQVMLQVYRLLAVFSFMTLCSLFVHGRCGGGEWQWHFR
jgi:hypothetical protein